METANRTGDPLVNSLRDHVCGPLEAAEKRVERERDEVRAERRAYERFRDRIASIDTVSTSRPSATSFPRTYTGHSDSRELQRLRNAFRTTVMDVDHYDEVYGESLDEHVVAELSADVATLFRDTCTVPFTETSRSVLTATVQRAITRREEYLDTLEKERKSLDTGRQTLTELHEELETHPAHHWGRGELGDTLDDLARQRQRLLQNRPATARTDGHDLCTHLYREEDWSYPLLTALTRFRRALV